MNEVTMNNKVTIIGEIVSGFRFSHKMFGEKFYLMDVEVPRLSGSLDKIPVIVSDRLVDVEQDFIGVKVKVEGQFRSYNRHEEVKTRLILSVFALEIELVDEIVQSPESNQICLNGFICKEPIYRETPLGREIADILIAVNRPYGKSDYIPCICWGRNARFVSGLEVGTRCIIKGRIQSREYNKKISESEVEKKIAYEVSVSRVEVREDEE